MRNTSGLIVEVNIGLDNFNYVPKLKAVSENPLIIGDSTYGNFTMDNTTGSWANVEAERVYPPWSPPELDWTWIVLIPLYVIIFVLSVVGNALVIVTLVQNKRMRTVTNAFLLNLSISDLLLAVLCMPFTIVPMILQNFVFGEVVCYLIRYLQGKILCCIVPYSISIQGMFVCCIVVCWIIRYLKGNHLITLYCALFDIYTR